MDVSPLLFIGQNDRYPSSKSIKLLISISDIYHPGMCELLFSTITLLELLQVLFLTKLLMIFMEFNIYTFWSGIAYFLSHLRIDRALSYRFSLYLF